MVQDEPLLRSMPTTSSTGSGSISHTYIQYPPLHVKIPAPAGLMYDDGNKLLLVPSVNKVLSWQVKQQSSSDNPSVTNFEDGPVLFARFSLDEKILAIQRSAHDVEFFSREDGAAFSQHCKQGTDQILGFFWTDCPICDVVFVTNSGLELYALHQDRSGLKLVEVKKLTVSWYVYTHESRLILLASGMQCKTLSGFQFSAGGIIRLPKFDVEMAKAEVNSKPVLAFQDVHICTMYGRLYCLQVDRVALQLHLYRFYRDAVVLQGSLPIYSGHVAVSVVDNVLLVHEIDSKVILLYDVMSDSTVPVSAPLPLLLRGVPSNNSSWNGIESSSSHGSTSLEVDEQLQKLSLAESTVYDIGWVFVNPDIVIDHVHGLLWKLQLDLEAIAASSSDILSLLAFLQRRSHEATKAKLLSLEVVRSMIMERQPLPIIGKAMCVLTSSYARSAKHANDHDRSTVNKSRLSKTAGTGISTPSQVSGESDRTSGSADSVLQPSTEILNNRMEPSVASAVLMDVEDQGERHSKTWEQSHERTALCDLGEPTLVDSPSISPKEMQHCVFSSLEKDMIVDSSFVVSTIFEYLYSALAEHLSIPTGLYVLIVQLLGQQQQYYELWLLMAGKVVPPSKAVAQKLLELGTQDKPTRKLGLSMMKEVERNIDTVNLLLQEGQILEGLRYARENKIVISSGTSFLQAAAALKEPEKLATVYRFCLDYVPKFKEAPDFKIYDSILRHQCNTT